VKIIKARKVSGESTSNESTCTHNGKYDFSGFVEFGVEEGHMRADRVCGGASAPASPSVLSSTR
jgi:hypothetical protein